MIAQTAWDDAGDGLDDFDAFAPVAKPADRRRLFTAQDIPNALWPSDNEWGIPLLRPDLQADALDVPVLVWGDGRGGRRRRTHGTWAFYTDDYRFTALWTDPSPVLNTFAPTVIEPNFTVIEQTPRAVALYRIYQKRWLARLWQEFGGVRIFVDLNVSPVYAEENLLGVPQGWRAYATHGYTEAIRETVAEWELAKRHAGSDDLLFVVYGGGAQVRQACLDHGWIWVPEQRDVAKGRWKEESRG